MKKLKDAKPTRYIKVRCNGYFGIHKQDYTTVAMDVPDEETANHLIKCLNGRAELIELLQWAFQFVPFTEEPLKFNRIVEILKEEGML